MSTDRRFRLYAGGVFILGTAAFAVSVNRTGMTASPLLGVMVLAVVVAEALEVRLGEGSIALSYPLSVATLALLGPSAGGAVAAACMLPALLKPAEIRVDRYFFNLGQLVLCSLLAGWVYLGIGGRLLVAGPLGPGDFPRAGVAASALVATGVLTNFMLVSIGLAIKRRSHVARVWRSNFSWMMPTQVALGLVGLVIAQVIAVVGIAGLALFIAPLLVARDTYHRYVRLRDAYADTVRSLVATIEAKDPYTKGHSVRVAEYSLGIGQQLALADSQLERLEYAALLHDLGKVGVSRTVLAKAGALSNDEFAEVRRHPDIGASILESVPYLQDIVTVVQHHHERVDGSGYVDGLRGDAIPIAARILAVADAYDAMTSRRPYREALSGSSAMVELRSVSGTQLDPIVVEAMFHYLEGRDGAEADSWGVLADA